MADWPEVEELRKVLDIGEDPDHWSTTADRVLAAAIERVKSDIGVWDELLDAPTDSQAQAALYMAQLIAERPTVAVAELGDKMYYALLQGQRKRFPIA